MSPALPATALVADFATTDHDSNHSESPNSSEPVRHGEALARGVSLTRIIEDFEAAEAGARAGFRAIAKAQEALGESLGIGLPSPPEYFRWGDDADAQRVIDLMTRNAWSALVDRAELRAMMSIKDWEKLQRDLKSEPWPPITVESVRQFVQSIRSKAPDMHRAAVLEVFEWLRPHEHDHVHRLKTNTELEIGRKVILGWMIDSSFSKWGQPSRVNYSKTQHLVALENVLRGLDGRGTVSKTYQSELQTAIERVSLKGETSLFKYAAHKNGNLHLEFKRLDLLAKFNAIAGGKTLRPDPKDGNKSKRSTRQAARPVDARSAAERSEAELGFFATPDALADRLVEMAGLRYNDNILEPSAGEGAIALAIRRLDGQHGGHENHLTCIELHPDRAAKLRALGFKVVEADFMSFEPTPTYAAIIANPSFSKRQDVEHVARMLRWLRPGGALVSIMSAGAMFRDDHAAKELRRDVEERGGRFEALEDGAFEEAGTMVRTCVCVIPRSGK